MSFDPNHTYRTRCGQHVTNVHPIGKMLRGFRLCDQSHFVWFDDGRIIPEQDNFDDLMPGAIEDEALLNRMPTADERIDATQKRLGAQAETIAGMAAKIEELENRAGNTSVSNARMISEIGSLQRRVVQLMNARETTKPTIKGGWVNVYRKNDGEVRWDDVAFHNPRHH